MDKILSDEEKLRRAEAISEIRSSRIPVNNLNSFNKRKKSRFEKYSFANNCKYLFILVLVIFYHKILANWSQRLSLLCKKI